MATTETFVHGHLYEVPPADLQPDPNQPRKNIDPAALEELSEWVKPARRGHRLSTSGRFTIIHREQRKRLGNSETPAKKKSESLG